MEVRPEVFCLPQGRVRKATRSWAAPPWPCASGSRATMHSHRHVADTDREDDEGQVGDKKAALESKRSRVVQEAREARLACERELAGKEYRFGKPRLRLRSEAHDFAHDVVADGGKRRRAIAVRARPGGVALGLGGGMGAERFDLGDTLEVAGITIAGRPVARGRTVATGRVYSPTNR